MKLIASLTIGFLSACLASAGPAKDTQLTFNAAADFSVSKNPNGPWSYGWTYPNSSQLNLYRNPIPFAGLRGWVNSHAGTTKTPNVFKNLTDSTIIAVDTVNLNPHQMTFHPGPHGEHSIVRWTAPFSGPVTLNAGFEGRDFIVPTSSDVAVVFNRQLLFARSINGFGPETHVSFSTNLTVRAGDTIDFKIGYGDNLDYGGDTTQIEAEIVRLVPNQNFADLAGNYIGALYQAPGFYRASGNFSLRMDAAGQIQGNLTLGGISYVFTGQLDSNRNATITATSSSPHLATVRLQLRHSNTGFQINGVVAANHLTAVIFAPQQ